MGKDKDELVIDIVQELAVLYKADKGWTKEINRVSWNGGDPKFDIRSWAKDREKPYQGISLNEDEARLLLAALQKYFDGEDSE